MTRPTTNPKLTAAGRLKQIGIALVRAKKWHAAFDEIRCHCSECKLTRRIARLAGVDVTVERSGGAQ
jgi:ribulose 1,5-bisphosphate carboxylase large subunit-like protein